MINYADTSHKLLGLAVAEIDLDVSALHIISSRVINDIEIGVLGASHYVKFRNGSNTLTEVFACKKLEGGINYYPLESIVGTNLGTENNSFKYECSIEVISDKRYIKPLIEMFEEAETKKDGESLMELFPTKEEPPFKACTYINVKEYTLHYRVQTLHTYPEEEIIVYTLSKITRK